MYINISAIVLCYLFRPLTYIAYVIKWPLGSWDFNMDYNFGIVGGKIPTSNFFLYNYLAILKIIEVKLLLHP